MEVEQEKGLDTSKVCLVKRGGGEAVCPFLEAVIWGAPSCLLQAEDQFFRSNHNQLGKNLSNLLHSENITNQQIIIVKIIREGFNKKNKINYGKFHIGS